jgi:hypothetical protein
VGSRTGHRARVGVGSRIGDRRAGALSVHPLPVVPPHRTLRSAMTRPPYPTASATKRGVPRCGVVICFERPVFRQAVAGDSGVATAGRTKRPTACVASHLDPLSAPRTGPQIRVVREGRDGSQSHPGMDVPIEEIHLHEVISANGHVVPPSRLPRVLLYPLEPPANQGHYPGTVQAGGCPRRGPTATSRPS